MQSCPKTRATSRCAKIPLASAILTMVSITALQSGRTPVSNPSSESFHKFVLKEVPESIGEMIAHNVAAIRGAQYFRDLLAEWRRLLSRRGAALARGLGGSLRDHSFHRRRSRPSRGQSGDLEEDRHRGVAGRESRRAVRASDAQRKTAPVANRRPSKDV